MSACLDELGWEVVDASTGEAKVPEEQLSLYQDDLESCHEQLGSHQQWAPLTEAELTELYELEMAAAECLRDLGYTIDAPSLQKYIDTYDTEPFIAHMSAETISPSQLEECPPASWTYQR